MSFFSDLAPHEKFFFVFMSSTFTAMTALIAATLLLGPSEEERDLAEQSSLEVAQTIFDGTSASCDHSRASPRINDDFLAIAAPALQAALHNQTQSEGTGHVFYTTGVMHELYEQTNAELRSINEIGLSYCFDRELQNPDGIGNYNIGAVYYPESKTITINPILFNNRELASVVTGFTQTLNDNPEMQSQSLVFIANGRGVTPLKSRNYWTPLSDWTIQPTGTRQIPEVPLINPP